MSNQIKGKFYSLTTSFQKIGVCTSAWTFYLDRDPITVEKKCINRFLKCQKWNCSAKGFMKFHAYLVLFEYTAYQWPSNMVTALRQNFQAHGYFYKRALFLPSFSRKKVLDSSVKEDPEWFFGNVIFHKISAKE